MKKVMTMLALALAFAGSAPVLAHESPARHGGIVKSAGDMSFELVNKEGKTTLYVDDHGQEMATAGASGTLTVLKGTEKSQFALVPGEKNTLVAREAVTLARGNKVVAAVVLPNKQSVSVRFAIK